MGLGCGELKGTNGFFDGAPIVGVTGVFLQEMAGRRSTNIFHETLDEEFRWDAHVNC